MNHWELPWRGHSAEVDAGMVGQLMDALGSTSFPNLLFQLLSERVPQSFMAVNTMDQTGLVRLRWLEAPTHIEQEYFTRDFQHAIKHKLYLRDPFIKLMPRIRPASADATPVIMLHCLQLQDVKDDPWREETYQRTGIQARLAVAVYCQPIGALELSLFRRQDLGDFLQDEIDWVLAVAPLVMRLLSRHEEIDFTLSTKVNRSIMETRLARLQKKLTPREIEVCARMLQGCSAADIAEELHLKLASVKTFRNRAFEKLSISSRFELFALFIT